MIQTDGDRRLDSLLQAARRGIHPQQVSSITDRVCQEILLALSESDIVVATRFHNVLLSSCSRNLYRNLVSSQVRIADGRVGAVGVLSRHPPLNARKLIEQFQDLEKHSE